MSLKDIYENSQRVRIEKTRIQASGEEGLTSPYGVDASNISVPGNYFPDDYQAQFKTRGSNNRNIRLSQQDDSTEGSWKTNALNYYGEKVTDFKLASYRGSIVHLYNARAVQTHYSTLNARMPGVALVYGGNP